MRKFRNIRSINSSFYRRNKNLSLNRKEEWFEITLESIGDGVITTDIEGNIIFFNKSAQELTEWTRKEAVGNFIDKVFKIINKDTGKEIENYFKNAIRTGSKIGLKNNTILIDKSGTERYVSASISPIRDKTRKIIGTVLVFRDITKIKIAEESLKKLSIAAEMANEAKSEFLANMSHEIRTPLNGVKGMIDLTMLTELTDEQKDNLQIAGTCANSLLNIINDILDFSKIEAGKLLIENIEFDIEQFVERAIKAHSVAAKHKGLSFTYNINCGQMPKIIIGDPNRLQQILDNLIGNAIKFTEDGGISISMDSYLIDEESIMLKFGIGDTGIGISKADMGYLFKSFSQVDGTITRKYGGTGLGLVISKSLVRMMSGSIWLKSEKGKGSNFYFTVKFRYKNGNILHIESNEEPNVKVEDLDINILVAEDNKMNQIVIYNILKRKGYSVQIVDNGKEAVEEVGKGNIDLIFMDIHMPEMDGREAAKIIRDRDKENNTYTPIIALTAYALKGDREKFLEEGMDDYISKPIDMGKLYKSISNVMVKKKSKNSTKHKEEKNINVENKSSKNIHKDLEKIICYIEEIKSSFKFKDKEKIEHLCNCIKDMAEKICNDSIKRAAFKIQLHIRKNNYDNLQYWIQQLEMESEYLRGYNIENINSRR